MTETTQSAPAIWCRTVARLAAVVCLRQSPGCGYADCDAAGTGLRRGYRLHHCRQYRAEATCASDQKQFLISPESQSRLAACVRRRSHQSSVAISVLQFISLPMVLAGLVIFLAGFAARSYALSCISAVYTEHQAMLSVAPLARERAAEAIRIWKLS